MPESRSGDLPAFVAQSDVFAIRMATIALELEILLDVCNRSRHELAPSV